MIRVGFSGTPGSGKTSTARMLAGHCRKIESLRSVELIYEYARRYISKHGSIDNVWEQYRILEKQIEWEQNVENSNLDVLITDCPVFVGFAYTMDLKNKRYDGPVFSYPTDIEMSKEDMVVSDLFKKMLKINKKRHYDIIFHIPPLLEPVDDGIRPSSNFDPLWREKMDNRLKFVFDLFPPKKFITVEAEDIHERVDFCISHIKETIR